MSNDKYVSFIDTDIGSAFQNQKQVHYEFREITRAEFSEVFRRLRRIESQVNDIRVLIYLVLAGTLGAFLHSNGWF